MTATAITILSLGVPLLAAVTVICLQGRKISQLRQFVRMRDSSLSDMAHRLAEARRQLREAESRLEVTAHSEQVKQASAPKPKKRASRKAAKQGGDGIKK